MRPIVIIGAPRSFTSLTAGIFRDHGVWFGPDRTLDIAPTGSCENQKIKQALRDHKDGIVKTGVEAPPHSEWPQIIEDIKKKDGYPGGRWGAKHSAMYWAVWKDMNPLFICCRRDNDKVLKSNERAGFIKGTSNWLQAHIDVMDRLVQADKAVEVSGEEYFEGDFKRLKHAFDYCGIEFKAEIAENLINPEHWHVR